MRRRWEEEVNRILEEINSLFEEEKGRKQTKKNLELIRIYLPRRDYKLLEEYKPFKKLHNLGGIPCSLIKEKNIRIDTEVIDPRKRKKKAIIYVKEKE